MAFLSLLYSAIPGLACSHSLALAAAALVLYHIIRSLTSPLRHIPGPFAARFTNLWRARVYWHLTTWQTQRDLHARHGPAVRIGPAAVSLSDPALIPVIYGLGRAQGEGVFAKGAFYAPSAARLPDGSAVEHIFSARCDVLHARLLRPFQRLYSTTAVLGFEDGMDRALLGLCEQLEARFVGAAAAAGSARAFEVGEWVTYCSWGLIGEITWGRSLGFMQSGEDVESMIHTAELSMMFSTQVGQLPWLARLLRLSPYLSRSISKFNRRLSFSIERLNERLLSAKPALPDGDDQDSGPPADFFAALLRARKSAPETLTDVNIAINTMTNLSGGGDPIAAVQNAIIAHLLRNPAALARLREELRAANLSHPPSYREIHDPARLPYLDAVVREGLCIHPTVGVCIERIVPEQGLTLPDGRYIPARHDGGLQSGSYTARPRRVRPGRRRV
ncbi:hypothetical protein MAPG_01960 [Magnaporthiopsis poae ATCC 64411]|uniref:Cytochrome P450 n=1 Tax=Magnaporthiopsis poae (strain ATCC 64411 / 73-15) TaxID=644358 RepID=A0A0C4DQ23_MAGP6|nr:hypothetical protein MAPG_01960 [Magnaporthiopsis poae ATCC 64411]